MHSPMIMKPLADASRSNDLAHSALPDAPQVPDRPSRMRRLSATVAARLRREPREARRPAVAA